MHSVFNVFTYFNVYRALYTLKYVNPVYIEIRKYMYLEQG